MSRGIRTRRMFRWMTEHTGQLRTGVIDASNYPPKETIDFDRRALAKAEVGRFVSNLEQQRPN
jgi:hypothetical protein